MNAYLGIDVSKGYGDFTLLDQNKKELEKVFQLDDTRTGHDALEALLQKHIKDGQISMVYCAVESTGGFENNWYAALIRMGSAMPVKVARLNPNGVKHSLQRYWYSSFIPLCWTNFLVWVHTPASFASTSSTLKSSTTSSRSHLDGKCAQSAYSNPK